MEAQEDREPLKSTSRRKTKERIQTLSDTK